MSLRTLLGKSTVDEVALKAGYKKGVSQGVKIKLIPTLLEYHLTPEQIAEKLELDLQLIHQYINNQNHETS